MVTESDTEELLTGFIINTFGVESYGSIGLYLQELN